MAEIKDFGEKIGGAKKDLWKMRGFRVEDIEDMDERERIEYVKKVNVWAEPNYKEEVKNGKSPVVMYFTKKLRDALPATPKPSTYLEKYIKTYIEILNTAREIVEGIETESDLLLVGYKILAELQEKEIPVYREYSKALTEFNYGPKELQELKYECELQNFPEEYKGALKGVTIKEYETENGIRYVARKGYQRFSKERDNIEDVKKDVRERVELESQLRKKKREVFKVQRALAPELKREGPTYREGDVRGEDYLETFKLRGGEFGNWNNQEERQMFLNLGYDAFKDLARAVEVPDEFISLGGYEGKKLAIAFGARGAGRAAAHYEASSVVINLTKMRGAGSLAHEWGHALDDFLGIKLREKPMLSEYYRGVRPTDAYPEVGKAFEEVMTQIRYRPLTKEEALEIEEKQANNSLRSIEHRVKRMTAMYNGTVEENQKLAKLKDDFLKNPTVEGVDKLAEDIKAIKGRIPPKSRRDDLKIYVGLYTPAEEREAKVDGYKSLGNTPSEYVKHARILDRTRNKPYYGESVELFARAFESFVYDELKAQGIRSDYLVQGVENSKYAGAETPEGHPVKPYPEGEERERINAAFRVLMVEVMRAFGGEVITEVEEGSEQDKERKAKFMIVEFKQECQSRGFKPDMGETKEVDGTYIIELGEGKVERVVVPKDTMGYTEAVLKGEGIEEVYKYTKPDLEYYDYAALADFVGEINDRAEEEGVAEVDKKALEEGIKAIGLPVIKIEDIRTLVEVSIFDKGINQLVLTRNTEDYGMYAIERKEAPTIWGDWEAGEYNLGNVLIALKGALESKEEVKEIKEEIKEKLEVKEFKIPKFKQELYKADLKMKVEIEKETEEMYLLELENGMLLTVPKHTSDGLEGMVVYKGYTTVFDVQRDKDFNYEGIVMVLKQKIDEQRAKDRREDAKVLEKIEKEKEDKKQKLDDYRESLKAAVIKEGMRLTVEGDAGIFYYPITKEEQEIVKQQGFPANTVFSHAKTRYGKSKESTEAVARKKKGKLIQIKVDLGSIKFDRSTGLFVSTEPLMYYKGVWVGVEQQTDRDHYQVGEQGLRETILKVGGVVEGTTRGRLGSDVIERWVSERGFSVHYGSVPENVRQGNSKAWAITNKGQYLVEPTLDEEKVKEGIIEAYATKVVKDTGRAGVEMLMLREGLALILGERLGIDMGRYCKSRAFEKLESQGQASVLNYIKQLESICKTIR